MDLSDSWVEVQPKPVNVGASLDTTNDPVSLEALLKEAQKEGSSSRSVSGNNTPPSLQGSNVSASELNKQCADWIWDWSSRPETNASRAMSAYSRMCSPKPQDSSFSIRKSALWKETNSLINIYYDRFSFLVFTHTCSFLLGATAVFFIVRKWKSKTPSSTLFE